MRRWNNVVRFYEAGSSCASGEEEKRTVKKEAKKGLKKAGAKKVVSAKESARKAYAPPVLYSPVEVSVVCDGGRKKTISGVLLPKKTMAAVVKLLDKSNANGLSGRDAVLALALRNSLLSFIA